MKKTYEKWITPIILLVISLVLFGLSFVNFCVADCGWNPLCYLMQGWCNLQQGLIHLLFRVSGFIIFIIFVLLIVRIGLKR